MSTNQEGIGRRDFLVISSVALASAAMAPKLFAGSAGTVAARVTLGWAPLDESRSFTAATDVPSSDGAFISRGARITVFRANSSPARGQRAAELQFNYSISDGGTRQDVPFRVWAQGTPTSFTVPVDEQQKISLVLRTAEVQAPSQSRRRVVSLGAGAPSRDREMPVELTLLSGASALKLARGYYALVPMADGQAEPRWGAYSVGRTPAGTLGLIDDGGAAAPFEHILVRVDYAAQ